MKIILDIDESAYLAIKNGEALYVIGHDKYDTVVTNAFKNSVLYEETPQSAWEDYDNTFYKCPECGYLLEKCCPQCQTKVILPKNGVDM